MSLFACVGDDDAVWHSSNMSEELRNKGANWLPHYVFLAKTNGNQIATKLGVDRQRLSVLMKRDKAVPPDWAERIAPLLGVSAVELVYGPGGSRPVETEDNGSAVVEAHVAGRVAAGMWLEDSYVDGTVYDPVPIVLARYPTLPQTAYKVSGPSMEKLRIFDGDYVITVPYWQVRSSFQNNDVVVVERREGGKFERTCKQVQVFKDRVELWPRSDHEAFQEPLIVPISRTESDDGQEVEVVGLVIGKHSVM